MFCYHNVFAFNNYSVVFLRICNDLNNEHNGGDG